MNHNALKSLLMACSALALTACGALEQLAVSAEPRPSRIVSPPPFTGQPSPHGPLKRETPELRERLKDPKAFYRYQYTELWMAGTFAISRGVVVFAAPGRPLRSADEIAGAAQCVEDDLRKSVSPGSRVALADKKLLLTGTNWQDMNDWHNQMFGKKNHPLDRNCRIGALYDM